MDVSEWLLSGGYAAAVNAERRPHPAGGTEEILGRTDGPSKMIQNGPDQNGGFDSRPECPK